MIHDSKIGRNHIRASRAGARNLLSGVIVLALLQFFLFGLKISAGASSSPLLTPTISGSAICCAGSGGYVYLTEPGMTNYLWTLSAGGTISSGSGTNSIQVSWNAPGSQTVSVTYTGAAMPTVMNVTVLSVLPVAINISPSANPVCQGATVIFTSNVTNGGTSPVFQWKVNGIVVGTNSASYAYTPSNGDAVTCQVTSDLPCVSGNPANSPAVIMSVSPGMPVNIFTSASANPVCQGSPVIFTATPTNGGSAPVFQWKVNGINSGTNNAVFTFAPANGDVVTCQVTSNAGCASGNPATSSPLVMTVSPLQPVGISVTASSNPSCQGNPVSYTATPVNGGSNPIYQWRVNGINAGVSNTGFSYTPANGDLVTCQLLSSVSCASGNPATSTAIQMTVNQSLPVSVSIISSGNPICQGIPVIFTATPVNAGSAPLYQWFINGFNIGVNSSQCTYTPANGDNISCQITSGSTCVTGNPAMSNVISMSVTPVLPVNITITASSNPVCLGNSVTFTAVPYNGGSSPAYQWKVNGTNTGANSPTFSYFPVYGDVVTCLLTSNANCAPATPVASNAIAMTVGVNQPVGVSIATPATTVCQGMTATFTATPSNGGSSPSYTWKVNGVVSGTNSPVFSYIPTDGDIVICQLNSSAGCTLGNPATSNAIAMTVTLGQTLPVSISIAASANPSCQTNPVTYTATAVNGGTTPVYQWIVNGLNVGMNSPVYQYTPSNGDFVKCLLTSSYSCATGNPATSNLVGMTVNPILTPSVSIVCTANPSCLGSAVTYTANAVNPGTSPVYTWKVNGANAGTNMATFTYNPANGDIITCQLMSGIPCPFINPVISNAITMSVLPVQPVAVSISASNNPSCQFTQVVYTATPSNGGSAPVFLWKLNGVAIGSNNPIVTFIPVNGDVVTCQLTSNATCVSGSRTVLSNVITMVVSSELAAGVSITSSANPFCQGTAVTYTAATVNGGTTPVYLWKVNCSIVGTNSPTLTYVPSQGDFVTCQMTSNLTCAILNPAISNAITMAVNTTTPLSVTVAPSANPVCPGSPVTFAATVVNGGSSPVYQWKVNGANTGTNSSSYTYTPVNGSIVSCSVTSNAACVSNSPATSAPVTMSVSSSMPASLSISTPTNPFCAGSAVTFQAAPVNGGTSPIFQWKVNGNPTGSNSPAFSFSPAGGDVVTCNMTSNSTCLSGGNPIVSNTVTLSSQASLPVSIAISHPTATLCQGIPETYTATAVNGGNNPVYQWKVNGLVTGSNNPVFSYIPSNGDVATCQVTSDMTCATGNPATSNALSMTVNPAMPVSVVISVSCNPCCQGIPVTFTATPTNGGTVPGYQWKVNCVNVGSNNSTYTYIPANGDVVVCVLTSNAVCSTGNPAISNNINMVVLPMMPVSLTITTSVNPFCLGISVTFTAVPVNEGQNPIYQWKVNGANAGINTATFIYPPADGDVVTCQLTSSLNCVSGNPAISNAITMVGNSALPVSIITTASLNPICQGTLVTFIATPVNQGSAPIYQWKVNGVGVGTSNKVYQYYPLNGDVVVCQLTSSLNCAAPIPAVSIPINMTVYPQMPVSVTVAASSNPSCVGNTVNYSAAVVNGGNPVYRWRVNGVTTGPNSSAFSYFPATGDVVNCRVTSDITCATGNPANSNNITMIVSPNSPATVNIGASANPICQGTMVTFSATPFNGGTAPSYQWKVNGVVAGTDSPSFSYAPSNADVVVCQMTSNSPCISINVVVSNAIIMTVSPIQPVSLSIAPAANPTCIGSVVNYTANGVNPGTSPVYQWKVNGTVVGSNNPIYTYTPVNGDILSCRLTSDATCSTGNPANSNTINMTVSQSLPVSASVTMAPNPVCQGQPATCTALPGNGGINPVYQWRVNGIDIGSDSPILNYIPTNGDLVVCQLTSSFSCATGNPATSNLVSMTVNGNVPVSIAITSSANPVCQGSPVTYTATPVNGGTAPVYHWKRNGINVGSNLPYFSYLPVNGDIITCELNSNDPCPVGNPVVSNSIAMMVLTPVPATISISPSLNPTCQGTPVTYNSSVTNGGSIPAYQWKVSGVTMGTNLSAFSYIPANGDIVTCQVTSNATCITSNTAVSNPVTMVVSTDLPVNVSISASANPSCQGQSISYTAAGVNGGLNPVYHWMVNNFNVGTNNPVFTYFPSNGDIVKCQLQSELTCASGNPATSNLVTMTTQQNVPVSLLINVASNPVCLGTSASFSAFPTNGGTLPGYQWKVNGVNTGTGLSGFSYIPVNGDIVTCQLTSSEACVTGNPAASNPVVMAVSTQLPVSVVISASTNPLCQSVPVTFTASATNGGTLPAYQWMVNGLTVGSNNAILTFTPSNGDVITCRVTSDLTCATGSPALSNAITMSVNTGLAAGVAITANPAGTVCQGTPVTLTASPSNGGTPYFQWYLNNVPIGTNQPTYTYVPSNGDQVHVIMNSNLACISGNPATSNSISFTVNPALQASVSLSASQVNVCQGTSVTFTATPTNGGLCTYQWYRNGIPAGINQPTFACIPAAGDQVYVVMTSGLPCISGSPATSSVIAPIVSMPAAVGASITASQTSVCMGTSVTITAAAVNGGNPSFQWFVNGTATGGNQPTFSFTPANGDQVYAIMTSNLSCVTGNPATSNVVTLAVNTPLVASAAVTVSQNNVCQGTAVTFTAIPQNGGTPSYQWYKNGVATGLNQPTFNFTPTNGDQVYVVMTSGLSCITGSPSTSNIITMVVNPLLTPAVSVTVSQNNICQGVPVTFTATPANGGTPAYQWYKNGLPAGLNQPVFTYTPANNDQVYVVVTSSLACVTGNPATSNTITMTVNPILPAGISVAASQNNICQGTPVVFTATPSNGGTPVYQWFKNGAPVGLNQPTYGYTPANGDQVYATMTSGLSCVSGSPGTSNVISMQVNALLAANVSVNPSQNNVCQGTLVTFTAAPQNGGTPVYQWYKNGAPVGLNQPTFAYVPANGDQVYVIMTSGLSCITGSPATSNIVTMTVNPQLTPLVSVTVSQNNICQGVPVTLSATPTNGGTPSYQWYKNGISAGLNQPVFNYTPANNDQVYVVVTSSLTCVSGNPATSNTITMTVNPILPAGISIAADQNNVCLGTPVLFTATPANGGTPVYQWYKNGLPVGLNQPTYGYTPVNGDQVYATMTSGLACVSGSPATSNTISMQVNAPLPVSVTVLPDQNNICAGAPVLFTATPVNGGASPVYQWYRNGNAAGTNQPTFTCNPVNGDHVFVVMNSAISCSSGNPATSDTAVMVVNPILPVSVSVSASQNNVCEGTQVTMTASPVNGGTAPLFQWFLNGAPAGTGQSTFTFVPLNGDQVYAHVISSLTCISGSPATSNTIVMTVNPILPASVTIQENQNNVCAGAVVTVTASAVNGGISPVYEWYRNSIPVGTNQPSFTFIPGNGDQVYVVMTSGLSCISGSPATSNTVMMIVNPILPVSATVTVDHNNTCLGTPVTFTAGSTNGGTPAYQWYLNGIPAGLNQVDFTYVPADGDQVYVMVTSSLTCVSGNPASSGSIMIVVRPPMNVSVGITPDQNSPCEGTPVTFTAAGINGGVPVYQWYVNNLPVGTDQPVYVYTPLNGDQVTVKMTSSLDCISGSPATSTPQVMTVNPFVAARVSITADQGIVCVGSPVTLIASPVNGGTPSFQWYVNGARAGENKDVFSYVPAGGDQVNVIMTSGMSCVTGSPAGSNVITMAVRSVPGDPGAIVGPSSVCAGSMGSDYSTSPVAGADSYQWNLPAGMTIAQGQNTAFIRVNFSPDATSGDITVKTSNSCGSGPVSQGYHVEIHPVPVTPVASFQSPVLQSTAPKGNQWYYQGAMVPAANDQTYHPLHSGWYWSVVTLDGCISDSSNHVYFSVEDSLGLIPAILVYPVPNDGHFTVEITLRKEETFDISFFNALGIKFFELPGVYVKDRYKKVIDLRPKPKGVYTVLFKCADYKVIKKILIYNR